MAETNPKVLAMVEEELRKNPNTPSTELFQKAQKIDKSIADLNIRQFNARYPLQLKRRAAPPRPRARRAEGAGAAAPAPRRRRREGTDRTAVRNVLIKLAADVAAAEGKADLIEVMGSLDRYVDQVVAAAGGR